MAPMEALPDAKSRHTPHEDRCPGPSGSTARRRIFGTPLTRIVALAARGGKMRRGGPSDASERFPGLLRSFPRLRNRPRKLPRSPPGF
eukprot:9504189-Pyramimonas_sp.AAC.1